MGRSAVLILILAGCALPALVLLSGHVYLPRHSAVRDLPWSQTERHQNLGAEPFNHTMSDKFNLSCPDVFHGITEIRAGRYPLWNDLILGGVPHIANPTTGIAYPPNLLLLLFDPFDALVVAAALHLVLCGLFMHLFLRRIGLDVWPALLGGIAFMFSGWVAGHLQNGMTVAVMSWIPLGLFAVESYLDNGRRRALLLLTVAIGMMWLAGFPQLAMLGTLACGLYALPGLLCSLKGGGAGFVARRSGVLMGFAVLGVMVAAIHLVPLAEVLLYGEHQNRSLKDLVGERYQPGGLVGLLLPGVMGDPMEATPWRSDLGARMLLTDPDSPEPELAPAFMNWSERTLYPGLITLLLALAGLCLRPPAAVLKLGFVALMGCLLAMMPFVIGITHWLPGFGVGAPGRAVFLLALAMPVFAAWGLQRLLEKSSRARAERRPILPWLVAVPAVFLVILVAWSYLDSDRALRGTIATLKGLGVESRLAGGADRPVAEYMETLSPFFQSLRRDVTRMAVVLGASALVLVLAWRRPRRRALLIAGCLVILCGDLLWHGIPPNLPVAREGLLEQTAGITFLRTHLEGDRFLRVHADDKAALAEGDALYIPNLGMLAGIRDAQGYREMAPRHYRRLWEGVSPLILPYGMAGLPVSAVEAGVLDLARIRYLVAGSALEELKDRQVHPAAGVTTSDLFIYSNPGVFPHAWVAPRAIVRGDEETLRLLKTTDFPLANTVILFGAPQGDIPESGESLQPSVPANEAALISDVPGSLEFGLEPGPDGGVSGLLVVSDTWYPGWQATLVAADGTEKAAEVHRAMMAFMAVMVQPDTVRVRLEFRPSSFTWGWIMSCLALGGAAFWAFLCPRGRTKELAP